MAKKQKEPKVYSMSKAAVYLRKYRSQPKGYAYYLGERAFSRCTELSNLSFVRYGGKGIEFRFNSIIEFRDYILTLDPNPVGKKCHRIDTKGHYERGNIQLLTHEEHTALHTKLRQERKSND